MIVNTLFQHGGRLSPGEVEVKLLPGIPSLHVVGMPDAHIRESGIRLKSALRTCDLKWPKGNQIVVNLRPSYFRKSSSGADLAIALGFLALTGQLNEAVRERMSGSVVYGEVALDGRVCATADLSRALRAVDRPLITGRPEVGVREGRWLQLDRLTDAGVAEIERRFDWDSYWQPPEFPDLELHPLAFQALVISIHMGLNVLVGGPPGSGKTTWARLLHLVSPPPNRHEVDELFDYFGDSALDARWRQCESPHHTITPQAMIGGGTPLFPGVISRAHGGVLIMDEFLEFDHDVLEALREPVECGYINLARRGERARFPAKFQLVGTTNLCPCGKLNLKTDVNACSRSLIRCRSVCERLSGPVMDRFDMLVFSDEWLKGVERVPSAELKPKLDELRAFACERGPVPIPQSMFRSLNGYSHRRRNSLIRVARGLADMEQSHKIRDSHFAAAEDLVIKPMDQLAQLFA